MRTLLRRLEPTTYARARLQLGVAGVGTFVVLAAALLALGAPGAAFSGKGGDLAADAGLIAVWLASLALLALPFEVLGGLAVPRAFRRDHPRLRDWVAGWLQGVLVVLLCTTAAGALVVFAGRLGGRPAAAGAFALVLLALVAFQATLARLVGALPRPAALPDGLEAEVERLDAGRLRVATVAARDEGFTGGVAGLPGAARCVLPAAWLETIDDRAVAALVARRATAVDAGLRALGVAGAAAWTLAAFLGCSFLPGAGVADVAGLLTTSLWFTLASFVGLLVLPTPTRAATRAVDARTVERHPAARKDLERALAALDRLQDDEPERPAAVEGIFHPIPSLERRRRALLDPRPGQGPWHLARTAIYLSIAGLNPLHRLVHCNVGRPELWVFLPADG